MDGFQRLISDNELDRAECAAWWASSTLAAKMAVLNVITAEYTDPAMEIMSRMAQLKFAELVEGD